MLILLRERRAREEFSARAEIDVGEGARVPLGGRIADRRGPASQSAPCGPHHATRRRAPGMPCISCPLPGREIWTAIYWSTEEGGIDGSVIDPGYGAPAAHPT